MKKKFLAFTLAFVLLYLSSNAQYLPLNGGGTVNGNVLATAFAQTGSSLDLAPAATLTTTGTNTSGGATNRALGAYTSLAVGQSLTVDLTNSAYTVNLILFGSFWNVDATYIPAGFNIDYSNDNSSWTNLVTVTGNTSLYPVYLPGINARYWRITLTACQSGRSVSNISGLQLITTGLGASVSNVYWNYSPIYSAVFTNQPISIGTTNPKGYMLAVNGSAIATSMKVKLNEDWPDYVFKSKYQLPTLTDVKSYIDQNHHLPDMPSADAVAKNGIDLGETDRLLTKKVEELTLYLIDKDRQVSQLQATVNGQKLINESLQKEIDELKNQLSTLIKSAK